jgi:hypothetical protein
VNNGGENGCVSSKTYFYVKFISCKHQSTELSVWLLFLYKLRCMLKMIMIRAIINRKISVIALSPEFTQYEYVHVLCEFWNTQMHCWELECKGMVQC